MLKKAFWVFLICFALTSCEKAPNLNPNNETGWTVLHGVYVQTESGHDVLVFEPQGGEDMYIFMTYAEECDAPTDLQTGDKLAIKTVITQETAGIHSAEVFKWEKYGNSPISVDKEVLTKIESLSQKLPITDAAIS